MQEPAGAASVAAIVMFAALFVALQAAPWWIGTLLLGVAAAFSFLGAALSR